MMKKDVLVAHLKRYKTVHLKIYDIYIYIYIYVCVCVCVYVSVSVSAYVFIYTNFFMSQQAVRSFIYSGI